jgi:hypothetical protein
LSTEVSHVYITAHGEFTNAYWTPEKAQIGLRLAFDHVATAPDKGETFTPLLNGDVVPEFGTQAGTNGTLTKTHKFRVGTVGSLENWTATEQIDAAEDVWTFLQAVKAYTYSGFRWTHVKLAAINALGNTVGTASTYTFTSPIVGTASTLMAPQAALAVTLRANIVGRKGRGRFYLPALSTSMVSSDCIVSSTPKSTILNAAKTMIDGLQNLPGFSTFTGIVCVTSAGAATAVRPVELRIGDRVDTIKSRRAQVNETYTDLAL